MPIPRRPRITVDVDSHRSPLLRSVVGQGIKSPNPMLSRYLLQQNDFCEEARESPRRSAIPSVLPGVRNPGNGAPLTPPRGLSPAAIGICGSSHFGRLARSCSPSPVLVPVPAGNVAAHASAINTRVAELGMTGVVPLPPMKANIGEGASRAGESSLSRTGSWSSLLLGVSGPMVVGTGIAPRGDRRGCLPSVPTGSHRGILSSASKSCSPESSKYVRSYSSSSASAVLMRSSDEHRGYQKKSQDASTNTYVTGSTNVSRGTNTYPEGGASCICNSSSDRSSCRYSSCGAGTRYGRGSVHGDIARADGACGASASAAASAVAHLVDIGKQEGDSISDSGGDTVPVSPESSSRDQE